MYAKLVTTLPLGFCADIMGGGDHLVRGGARRISNRNGYWFIGKTPDPGTGDLVMSEGSLERDFICRVQSHPEYLAMRSQPVKIRYIYIPSGKSTDVELLDTVPSEDRLSIVGHQGTKQSTYTPDYLVFWKTGDVWLVEVKSSRSIKDPQVQRKKAVGEAYAANQGWTYHLVSDVEIRAEPFLMNAQIQRRYRGLCVPADIERKIFEEVRRPQTSTIGDVVDRLGVTSAPAPLETYIYALIARHKLAVDDNQPLGRDSKVFLPQEGRGTIVRIF